MRKLVLITALLLASASAHAGQSRDLILAANDTPAATDTAAAPAPAAAPATAAPAATTDAPKPQADAEPAKPAAAKPAKRSAGRHEGDEAKARRIAARYGVYW
jgi:hypothetical protein